MFKRLIHRSKYGIAYTKIAVNESNMVDVGECYTGRIIDRLAAYEDSGLSPEEVQELAKAKADGRLVVLPCKVWELLQKYKELTEPQGDEAETYTTGYRNGHRNGQAELIAYLLQIDTGTREAAEKALERSGQDGCGEKNKA